MNLFFFISLVLACNIMGNFAIYLTWIDKKKRDVNKWTHVLKSTCLPIRTGGELSETPIQRSNGPQRITSSFSDFIGVAISPCTGYFSSELRLSLNYGFSELNAPTI